MRRLWLLTLLLAAPVSAAPIWILRGSVGECPAVTWQADALVHNTTTNPQVLRSLHVGGGSSPSSLPSVTVPPGGTVSLSRTDAVAWRPDSLVSLWLVQLDLPEGVQLENVVRVGDASCSLPPAPDTSASRGVQRIPARSRPVEAGNRQVFLETDLGLLPYHVNVGVYNAGADTAAVTAQVLSACDGTLLASATITVGSDSFTQFGLLPGTPRLECESGTDVTPWSTYTIVQVSQESIVWVSTVGNSDARSMLTIH